MSQSDLIALISGAAGIILSLAITYFKPLSQWFYSLDEGGKAKAVLGLNFLGALAVFGISCSQLFVFVACTQQSAVELLRAFFFMIVSNQATYLISPVSPTKKELQVQ